MVLALAVRLLDEAMALVIAARLACPSGPTEVDAEARVRRLVRLVAGDDGVRLDRLMRRLLSVCEWTRSEDNRRKLATCHSPQALWAKHRPKSYASVSTAPPEWVAAVQMFRGPVLYLILCREERDPELVMGILEVQTELGRAAVLALLKELI
jgi:hypothetical protein